MMTIAEPLRQKGRQEGVVIGEQKLIKTMLKRGYSAQTIEEITGISAHNIEALE